MSSSRKNPNTTRAYRERAQPLSRAKHGLLEKHKDYKLRAADHNAKRAKLRALQQKAAERNADEFYFGMMTARTDTRTGRKDVEDGKGGGRGNVALSQDVVRLLKTQDVGYVRTMLQRARREREALEAEVAVVEDGEGARLRVLRDEVGKGQQGSDDEFDMDVDGGGDKATAKHTVFVDDEEEQKAFNAAEWFGTDEKGLQQTYNRPRRRSSLAAEGSDVPLATKQKTKKLSPEQVKQAWKEGRQQQKRRALKQEQRLQKLAAVREREKSLSIAERELDLQRAKMENSVGGVNKKGVKFKVKERKR
ncbi:hypothetical protein FH972_025152 [Carpinus fangiana]|uniref:U3 small nucleolar RNA-associated protein 11 n=1 Tax=Carpinus fangiana TaxID=176857 RepID=A0A5N6L070_9ROSI|nr:hypothetical protein FH972_025152 [Carpinus fangiana]